MIGKFARGVLLGLLTCLTVGVWPAHADVSNVHVTSPAANQVVTGSYAADGTPSGFLVTLAGTAQTTCSNGWSSISFTISGPSPTQTFGVAPPGNGGTWNGGPTSKWNTQPLKNGVYTVRVDVVEQSAVVGACKGQASSSSNTAKVANRAQAPVWQGAPAAASNGSADVTIHWAKSPEPDVVEYAIVRDGPDGKKGASVSAANPDDQGCSVSGSVYTCHDTSFPASYDGSYGYQLYALRSRPAYNSGETADMCATAPTTPCVTSAGSPEEFVSLTAPTPSPTPSPTNTPSSTPSPGGSPGGGSTPGPGGGSTSSSGSHGGGLSFGSGGGSHRSDFYSGTYEETLPYQSKTLLFPPRVSSKTEANGVTGDTISQNAPDYRTVMLPVAGGLLAFLSAAHVRRLLIHL